MVWSVSTRLRDRVATSSVLREIVKVAVDVGGSLTAAMSLKAWALRTKRLWSM